MRDVPCGFWLRWALFSAASWIVAALAGAAGGVLGMIVGTFLRAAVDVARGERYPGSNPDIFTDLAVGAALAGGLVGAAHWLIARRILAGAGWRVLIFSLGGLAFGAMSAAWSVLAFLSAALVRGHDWWFLALGLVGLTLGVAATWIPLIWFQPRRNGRV